MNLDETNSPHMDFTVIMDIFVKYQSQLMWTDAQMQGQVSPLGQLNSKSQMLIAGHQYWHEVYCICNKSRAQLFKTNDVVS